MCGMRDIYGLRRPSKFVQSKIIISLFTKLWNIFQDVVECTTILHYLMSEVQSRHGFFLINLYLSLR